MKADPLSPTLLYKTLLYFTLHDSYESRASDIFLGRFTSFEKLFERDFRMLQSAAETTHWSAQRSLVSRARRELQPPARPTHAHICPCLTIGELQVGRCHTSSRRRRRGRIYGGRRGRRRSGWEDGLPTCEKQKTCFSVNTKNSVFHRFSEPGP